MAKGNGGWFGGWLGGLFDFNGDGKTDLGEAFIAYQMFEEYRKENDADEDVSLDHGLDLDLDPSKDDLWRSYREDGAEFGIFPEDYETEEEYSEALEEARDADDEGTLPLSAGCSAFDEAGTIKESDFPNKRRYHAAYALTNGSICYRTDEYARKEKERCEFIVEKADTVVAANYLSHIAGFLYAQAIKDNFELPVSLPDEDETREFELYQAICKIAQKEVPLSFEVWSWALEQFLPYAKYDDRAQKALTSAVIKEWYIFPDDYMVALVHYMDEHPDFRQRLVEGGGEVIYDHAVLIATAIREGLHEMAAAVFETCLKLTEGRWKVINALTKNTIEWCQDDEEVESIEYFRDDLLPLVKAIEIGMVQDEIEGWEKGIAEYIDQTEQQSEKYAYARRYAWRRTVPDGSAYHLDPLYYRFEQEYLEALRERKYGWRERYEHLDTLGLDVGDFETQEDFQRVFDTRRLEKRQKEREEREAERLRWQNEQGYHREDAEDKTVYAICGVEFPHTLRPYHYRTGGLALEIGDKVLVPARDTEVIGTVVSVGQTLRRAAPFPVDWMKTIVRKLEDADDESDGLDI